jgi:hypothetical protein
MVFTTLLVAAIAITRQRQQISAVDPTNIPLTNLPIMVIWNDTKDRQLLLIMIDLTPEEQAAGKKWDTVAAKMGEGFTAQAVR